MSELNPLHVPKPLVSQVDEIRHKKPVLESQLDLLREGTFSDVTFIVGPSKERIPCHQLFLKSRSPVFQVMFRSHHKEIPLEDVDPKIFTKFLEFIYADKFKATVPEALELLQVAYKYDVHLLVDKCEKLLESEAAIGHAIDVFQAARKYGRTELIKTFGDLMSKSLSQLQGHQSFSRLDKEALRFILKRKDLEMKEVDLFRMALRWANHQSGLTVHEALEDILPHIRFPVMTLEEFTGTVVPTGLLSQPKVIELFTYFGSDAETKKELARKLEFRSHRRNSPDSIVSLPVYSGHYEDKVVKLEKYRKLEDCLHFRIERGHGCTDEETTIGMIGMTVYCPTRENRYLWSWGNTRVRKLNVVLMKTADSSDSGPYNLFETYKYLLIMPSVEIEEGKVTEIKFDTLIPVKHGAPYWIGVGGEAASDSSSTSTCTSNNTDNPLNAYLSKDFGPIITANHEVKIGNKCEALLNVQRRNVNEVGDLIPQLICSLSFEEL